MKTHIQNQLVQFLNSCEVVQDERYNGWSLKDSELETIASYDANHDQEIIIDEVYVNGSYITLCSVGKSIVRDFLMEDNQNASEVFAFNFTNRELISHF